MENIDNTQEAEVKAPETEITVENNQDITPELEVEQTIGEMAPEKHKANMIPESVFLGEKKARKDAERELATLKKQIEVGDMTNSQVSDSVEAIAERHDIDKGFLNDLVKAIKADTEKELESKLNSKFEKQEKITKFEDSFNKGLNLALERGPEFKSIVNVEVLKQLAILPQNSNKTISQLIEETYSNALQGKRTVETTNPGGGKEPEPLDYTRAKTDSEYFKQIMSDPQKKTEYNNRMIREGF